MQTKDVKYIPFIKKDTPPATHLNTNILAKYREQMKKYYYDPTKYKTYLEQLGIEYPTVRKPTILAASSRRTYDETALAYVMIAAASSLVAAHQSRPPAARHRQA